MKVTKEQAAKNRAALVRSAGKLFREYGIDGVGIAEICKAAGLTHGALYAQFASKEELAAEALKDGLLRGRDWILANAENSVSPVRAYLDSYLSKAHRDQISRGCAVAASVSELARQDKKISAILAEAFRETIEAYQSALGKVPLKTPAHERAIAIAVSAIGAVVVSRALAKGDPKLSEEVLSATRRVLGEIAGESLSS